MLVMMTAACLSMSIERAHAQTEPPTAGRLLAQAKALEAAHQYQQAIAVYRDYLVIRPENDEVRGAVAKLLAWEGQYEDSVALYREILERHPVDTDSRVALARVLSWQKKYDEASAEYERVLRDEPNHAEAMRGYGDVLFWRGKSRDALAYYERVPDVSNDPELSKRIESIKADLAGAQRSTLSAAQSSPDNAIAANGALEDARRLETDHQDAEAARRYRDYLALRPHDDEARGRLARLLSRLGDREGAVALYRDILTRHPQDADVKLALARLLSWDQKFDEAMNLYEAVLQQDPDNREANRGLADVSFWKGDRKEALNRYEALYAETHDPDVERQMRAVKEELLTSPRAPVGDGVTGLRLPYRDYAKIGYGHYSYTKGIPDERDLLFEFAKSLGKQTLVARIEPISRFGSRDVPFSAELYSPLWRRAWGYVAGQGTVDPHFAPNYSFVGEVAQGLGALHSSLSKIELSFGYRHLRYKQDRIELFLPAVTVFLPFNMWLTEKLYYVPDTGAITLASQLTWRPLDRLQLFASGSFGTSGERIVATQDFTRVPSHTLQGGATFPINQRFSAEASGYYEDRDGLYVRRGGNLNLIYHW
jgi:YaiO family outer membrane protein